MRNDFDVIVLGSGFSGLAAALAASSQGLRTVVIEAASKLGGGSVDSYGILWLGKSHLAKQAGINDDLGATRAYVRFLAGGEASDKRLDAFVNQSPAALRYFQKCGVPFRLVSNFPDHYYGLAPGAARQGRSIETDLIRGEELGAWQNRIRLPSNQLYQLTFEEQVALGGMNSLTNENNHLNQRLKDDMRGKGLGLISHFVKLALEHKTLILTNTATRELVVKRGRVKGIVTTKGRTFTARLGVVLATGGYESNSKLVETFERMPGWVSPTPPELRGDGLLLGIDAGGATLAIRNNLVSFLGLAVPDGGGRTRFHPAYLEELCSPHTIAVNQYGQRFANETNFQMMVPSLRLFDTKTHSYLNLPAFLIFDQQYADKFSCAGQPRGAPIPKWIQRSSSLRGLASKLQIEATGLMETVKRYNAHVRSGRDEDFHRGELAFSFSKKKSASQNLTLGSLQKPPFYGVRMCTSGFSSVGLLTDEHARVVDRRGEPVHGLFALGNTSAHDEFGVGYQAGFSHTSSLTFGYRAVRHMSRGG